MPDPHYDALHFIFYSDDLAKSSAKNPFFRKKKSGYARQQELPGIDKPLIEKGFKGRWQRRRDSARYRRWIAFFDGHQDVIYLVSTAAVMLLQVVALAGGVLTAGVPFVFGFFAAAMVLGLFYGGVRYWRQQQRTQELHQLRLQVSGRWQDICDLQTKLSTKKQEKTGLIPSRPSENNLIASLRKIRRLLNEAREKAGLKALSRGETWVEYEDSFMDTLDSIQQKGGQQRSVFSKQTLDDLSAKIRSKDASPKRFSKVNHPLDTIERWIIYGRSWFSAFKNTRSILIALTGISIAVSYGILTGGVGFIVAGAVGGFIYGLIAQEHLRNCEYIFDLKQTMQKYNTQLESILAHLQLKERALSDKITQLTNQHELIGRECRYIKGIQKHLDYLWSKEETHRMVNKFYSDPHYHAFDLLNDFQQYLHQNAEKQHKGTVAFLRENYAAMAEYLSEEYAKKSLEDSKGVQNNEKSAVQHLNYYYTKCVKERVPGIEQLSDDPKEAYLTLRQKRFAHKLSL